MKEDELLRDIVIACSFPRFLPSYVFCFIALTNCLINDLVTSIAGAKFPRNFTNRSKTLEIEFQKFSHNSEQVYSWRIFLCPVFKSHARRSVLKAPENLQGSNKILSKFSEVRISHE